MSVRCPSGRVPDTCPVKELPAFTDLIRISQLSAWRMSDECPVRVSGHLSGGAGRPYQHPGCVDAPHPNTRT